MASNYKEWKNPDWGEADDKAEYDYTHPKPANPNDPVKVRPKKEVTLPMVYGFTPYNFSIGKVKGMKLFKPSDITATPTGLEGFWGFDTFPDCSLLFLIGKEYVTTTVKTIPAVYDNLIKFDPDPAPVRQFVFETFDTIYTQAVKAEYSVWSALIQKLVKAERNGGY